MSTAAVLPDLPRAFAVSFEDLERWDYSFFREINWQWSEEYIKPIASFAQRRRRRVDKDDLDIKDIPIIEKVSFGGQLSIRSKEDRKGYKGRLYWAESNDLIISKIRAKQGSLTIIPEDVPRVAVSAEYPVYEIQQDLAVPRYVKLVLRTSFFRRLLRSRAHGSSTKTRIKPKVFENIEIPLPPLSVQRAIVRRHQEAQTEVRALREEADEQEVSVLQTVLELLNVRPLGLPPESRAFALPWATMDRWAVNYARQASIKIFPDDSSYPIVQLGDVIADLENGWSPQCLRRPAKPGEWGVLKLGAVSFGAFDETENKALPSRLQPKPELEVNDGDVLISRANTLELVGACAWVEDTTSKLMLCDKIFRVVFKSSSPIDGRYLAEIIKIPHLRHQIEMAATGTSPSMKNISKPSLLDLRIPLPPLDVQREIVARAEEKRDEARRLRAAAREKRQRAEKEVERLILGTETLDAAPA